MPPTIKLVSEDEQEFVVEVKVAECSETIKTMLESLGLDEDLEEETIPLPKVRGEILKKVIKWAEHHKDDPSVPEKTGKEELSKWDADFLKVEKEVLFELTRAANYLDVKGLLDICCKAVANMMKGHNPTEIRRIFELS